MCKIIFNQDRSGRSALHWCAHHGHPACLKLLLAAAKKGWGGSDPPGWWGDPDQGGVTLLHLATRNPEAKCLQMVVKQVGSVANIDVQVQSLPQ